MEQEDRDLLIKIDTQQIEIFRRLVNIEINLSSKKCQEHTEKIRTLEKITWGALMFAVISMAKSFWTTFTG